MKKALLALLSVLIAGSLVLSGCTCAAPAPTGTTPPASSPTPTGTVATPLPPAPTTVLNLYGIDPYTLDPAVSRDASSHSFIMQLYSGLVRIDDQLNPVPDVAEDWDISDDGLTYTFRLRDDVKFQDGRKLTAEDVQYSWERAADPATGSLTAATYLGDIVGVIEKLSGQANSISGVKVLDPYTLRVTIDAPKSYFLSKLTYPTSFVVDEKNVKSGGEWWRHPNGTGPFKLTAWETNSSITLERSPIYYGQLAGVGKVEFQLYSGYPMNLYETGDIDVTGFSMAYIDRVTDPSGPFYNDIRITPELSFYYLGFNTQKPPFDDVNIRRAFSYAVDKAKLAKLVFRDMYKPANGILPPGMPGFNDNLNGLEYDIEKAKELIRQSRYGDVANLPPITITDGGESGGISSDLEAIIYEWKLNLGVDVRVRQLEPEMFIYQLKEEVDNMFFYGWIADYPHPHDFLDILFRTGEENNYGGYSNSKVDALLNEAAVEKDMEKSLALYQQAEQLIVDDAACLPLWFGQNYQLVKPYIQGYQMSPAGFAMLNTVTVGPH